jgi:isopenicillin N synthase-like dioxygenase
VQLVDAAENAGFLTLVDHGISVDEIEAQFTVSKAFFGLSPEIKGKTPHSKKDNNGWEYMVCLQDSAPEHNYLTFNRLNYDPVLECMIRRSRCGFREIRTGQVTTMSPSSVRQPKTSWLNVQAFRIRFVGYKTKFPSLLELMIKVSCFAKAIGFPEDYFKIANDPRQPDCLTQLRLIHYPASENAAGSWRAGSHTDIGCLTLLFQRDGEDGLEICPGRESHSTFAIEESFTPLPAKTGPIVVNIGDMLSKCFRRFLKSTLT